MGGYSKMGKNNETMGMIRARRAYRSQYDRGWILLARGLWWDPTIKVRLSPG